MSKESRLRILCVLCVSLVILVFACANPPGKALGAPDATVVRVLSPSGPWGVGDTIHVEVRVEDVTSLWGVDIRLRFDPLFFTVLDSDPLLPGVQIMPESTFLVPDLVLYKDADNQTGVIRYVMTQLGSKPSADGSGVVFSFNIVANRAWDSTLVLTKYQLATKGGEPIPATPINAYYRINGTGYLYLPEVVSNH